MSLMMTYNHEMLVRVLMQGRKKFRSISRSRHKNIMGSRPRAWRWWKLINRIRIERTREKSLLWIGALKGVGLGLCGDVANEWLIVDFEATCGRFGDVVSARQIVNCETACSGIYQGPFNPWPSLYRQVKRSHKQKGRMIELVSGASSISTNQMESGLDPPHPCDMMHPFIDGSLYKNEEGVRLESLVSWRSRCACRCWSHPIPTSSSSS